jgi:adenine-specific DNA-methyltransferase
LQALREREQQNQFKLEKLLKVLVNVLPDRSRNNEIEVLRRQVETTRQAMADLKAGKTLPLFLYRLHFAGVFEEKDGFDIVIANPPYVRHERVPQETLRALRGAYPVVQHGMADLYVYFYARALQLLREGGTLAFISSNKFFRTGYGRGLRDLLTGQTKAQIILDFGDAPVFDAAVYPCIVLVSKGKPASDYMYRGLTADNHIDLEKIAVIFESTAQTLPQAQGVQPPASTSAASALVQKLMQMGTPLGKYANGKIYYGIKTGLNEAFVIDQTIRDQLIAEDPRSAEVLKPFLRGRDIARYTLHSARLWLIFTRHGTDIKRYPAIERYLSQFREDLQPRQRGQDGRGRKPGVYKWYEIQDPVGYHQAFEQPKILSVRFGLQNGFVFDEQGFYANNATSFFSPGKKWLTAVLNSSVCNICLISICPSVQNGYSQFFTHKIEQLPIVEPAPADQARLVALVDQLQALGGQEPETERLEREVDAIVYRTYGLSDEEIAEIERWHAERRAQLGNGRRGQQAAADEEAEA